MEPVVCQGTCTVTLSIESAPLTEEKAADLSLIFWGFVLVAVTLWGLKRLLNIFSADHE